MLIVAASHLVLLLDYVGAEGVGPENLHAKQRAYIHF